MSISINNQNFKITLFDIVAKRENLNYILKFGLLANIAQYINIYIIIYNVHINDFIIILDVKLILYIFNCLESYQFSSSFVIDIILKNFHYKFFE